MAPIIDSKQRKNAHIGKNYFNGPSQKIDTEKPSWQAPGKQGLYDPYYEHEACGVGFIVNIDGKRSNKV